MKKLSLNIIILLVVFTQYVTYAGRKFQIVGDAPVLIWSTDPDMLRHKQAKMFRDWLKEKKYPDTVLKVDASAQGSRKQMIMGVSGVGGDLIQIPGDDIDFLFKVGILTDLSKDRTRIGLTDDTIHPCIRDSLEFEGQFISYPLNLSLIGVIVNRGYFRSLGMAVPPRGMDFETFTRIGREFVAKANAGKKKREKYFVHALNPTVLLRSAGVSFFNESLTASALGVPETAKIFRMYRSWIEDDHLIPSAAEMASFTSEQNTGGVEHGLFVHQIFGMIQGGRLASAYFRRMNATNLDITMIDLPHGGYVNSLAVCRNVTIYSGSEHKERAMKFLEFLTSKEYNLEIARDGEALPPNPQYLDSDAYLRPAGPNEEDFHRNIADMARRTAIGREYSPFIDNRRANQIFTERFVTMLSGMITPEQAASMIHEELNREIKRKISSESSLEKKFQKALERQAAIDNLKRAGKKIPLSLVDDTFLKKYYRDKGIGI